MRRSSFSRSVCRPRSATNRSTMLPTVRQEVRISWAVAVLEHSAAIQAVCWSKAWVCPAPWRAQCTAAAVTPCSRQATRGHVGLQEHTQHAVVQVAPPPSAPAMVVPGGRTAAAPPPLPPARVGPHRHDHALIVLVEADALDHGVFRCQSPLPYPLLDQTWASTPQGSQEAACFTYQCRSRLPTHTAGEPTKASRCSTARKPSGR